MNKNLIITAVIGALTIILGAFGAHALEDSLSVNELKSFETAVRYQMFHVLALLFVNTYKRFNSKTHLLCAHNGKEFDFPYLARRMVIQGIPLPEILNLFGKKCKV